MAGGEYQNDTDVRTVAPLTNEAVVDKKVVIGDMATTPVVAADRFVREHPEAISKVTFKFRHTKFSEVQSKVVNSGKKHIKGILNNTKRSVKKFKV